MIHDRRAQAYEAIHWFTKVIHTVVAYTQATVPLSRKHSRGVHQNLQLFVCSRLLCGLHVRTNKAADHPLEIMGEPAH